MSANIIYCVTATFAGKLLVTKFCEIRNYLFRSNFCSANCFAFKLLLDVVGGYDILDIPLYLQLLYTKQLNQYYLYKTEQYDRLPHLLLMEYNAAGRLLSSKLGLKISNTKPHLLEPSYFYKQFLQVINKYIGKNEIQMMKLRQMYSIVG